MRDITLQGQEKSSMPEQVLFVQFQKVDSALVFHVRYHHDLSRHTIVSFVQGAEMVDILSMLADLGVSHIFSVINSITEHFKAQQCRTGRMHVPRTRVVYNQTIVSPVWKSMSALHTH